MTAIVAKTIGSRLDERRGVAAGFDFLRLALAISIVAWHTNAIVIGDLSYDQRPFIWLYGFFILGAFFSLSGFLIAGSAQRLSLGNFLVNRGLRIVPALAVEIVLSAFILGSIFTTLSFSEYFRDSSTWHYLTNAIGWVNFVLPAVFKDHPTDIVNNSIWTVPHEIGCYIIMSGLILTGLLRKPSIMAFFAALIIVVGLTLPMAGIDAGKGGLDKIIYVLFVGRASRLYVFFLLGIFFYLRRYSIPYSWTLFLASIVLALIVGAFPQPSGINYPLADLLLSLPLCYITAFIGVTNVWIPKLFRKGDYSYGIYLYGWPLQQMLVSLLPKEKSLMLQFLLVVPLVTLFAAFSWHFIERPILQLRKKFSFIARVRLADDAPKSPELAVPAVRAIDTR